MARAIWKGFIAFGLVSIPVEIFPAEDRKEFKFSMLDKRDFSPVGYKRYSKKSGKEIEWKDIVKGYEYKKGEYVVLSDEDFRKANVKASRAIDIQTFVPSTDIPGQYFDSPYYLAPGKGSEKAYALLRETLHRAKPRLRSRLVLRVTDKCTLHGLFRRLTIVAVRDPAFKFLLQQRDQFLPGAPVVHVGINTQALADMELPRDVIGVPVKLEPEKTIEAALRLHPGARRVVAITGMSEIDRDWQSLLRRAFKPREAGGADRAAALTPRQREILQLHAEGKSARKSPRRSVCRRAP